MSRHQMDDLQTDADSPRGGGFRGGPPSLPTALLSRFWGWGWPKRLIVLALAGAFVYGVYFWQVRRVVVPEGHVLVLLKKDGSRSLPGDEFVIPRQPDAKSGEYAEWEKRYADCNGIMEEVLKEGTYFRFSPFDYDRQVMPISQTNAEVPGGKVGIVIRKFGQKLDPMRIGDKVEPGQVLAEAGRPQLGPLPIILQPGRYPEYANPYAYEIKLVDPVQVDGGYRGVVTLMSGRAPARPNEYLVEPGERGVQRSTEPPGFVYINPYEKRITPVSVQSHRFEMTGVDAIRFPSSDSFEIQLEGFVEWTIDPAQLPLKYVQYSEGGSLVEFIEAKVILPYARSLCRLAGSQYSARDFISGDTKLKFQQEFESSLRAKCQSEGIPILQALVRDIVPPAQIKEPINQREVAKQQVKSLEQQIQVAKSKSDLAVQEQMGEQNKQTGEANRQAITITKKAEQDRNVAMTQAQQRLEVAKLKLQAAQKEADAMVARGQAEAVVILLSKQAEAEPLRQQVQAFGDGNAYAQFFFFQKVAPAVKSILTDTDSAFGQIFRQFLTPTFPATPGASNGSKVTEVKP